MKVVALKSISIQQVSLNSAKILHQYRLVYLRFDNPDYEVVKLKQFNDKLDIW